MLVLTSYAFLVLFISQYCIDNRYVPFKYVRIIILDNTSGL